MTKGAASSHYGVELSMTFGWMNRGRDWQNLLLSPGMNSASSRSGSDSTQSPSAAGGPRNAELLEMLEASYDGELQDTRGLAGLEELDHLGNTDMLQLMAAQGPVEDMPESTSMSGDLDWISSTDITKMIGESGTESASEGTMMSDREEPQVASTASIAAPEQSPHHDLSSLTPEQREHYDTLLNSEDVTEQVQVLSEYTSSRKAPLQKRYATFADTWEEIPEPIQDALLEMSHQDCAELEVFLMTDDAHAILTGGSIDSYDLSGFYGLMDNQYNTGLRAALLDVIPDESPISEYTLAKDFSSSNIQHQIQTSKIDFCDQIKEMEKNNEPISDAQRKTFDYLNMNRLRKITPLHSVDPAQIAPFMTRLFELEQDPEVQGMLSEFNERGLHTAAQAMLVPQHAPPAPVASTINPSGQGVMSEPRLGEDFDSVESMVSAYAEHIDSDSFLDRIGLMPSPQDAIDKAMEHLLLLSTSTGDVSTYTAARDQLQERLREHPYLSALEVEEYDTPGSENSTQEALLSMGLREIHLENPEIDERILTSMATLINQIPGMKISGRSMTREGWEEHLINAISGTGNKDAEIAYAVSDAVRELGPMMTRIVFQSAASANLLIATSMAVVDLLIGFISGIAESDQLESEKDSLGERYAWTEYSLGDELGDLYQAFMEENPDYLNTLSQSEREEMQKALAFL